MPVFLAAREPDHIARPYFLDRINPALHAAASSGDDEGLTEGMGMPGCPRTRLKGDAGALNERRIRSLKKRIDPYRAREPLRWLA